MTEWDFCIKCGLNGQCEYQDNNIRCGKGDTYYTQLQQVNERIEELEKEI